MDGIYVLGAGGIGCAVGYALCAAGVEITFVDINDEKVKWGGVHGVGVDSRPFLPAHFISFDDWNPPPSAAFLLCTKCYDNESILARLPPSAALIPIQNGFDSALEARTHRLEGIASFVSECTPNRTHTRITRPGRLHLGVLHPHGTASTVPILDLLRSNNLFRVTWGPEILPYKYTKLMYNSAIGPLASLAGIDNGKLLSLPRARRLFFALLRENYDILSSAGVPLGKIGPFHPDRVNRILRRKLLSNVLAWAFYPSLKGTYCSMAGDLATGRTEIDNYNGRLIELAGDRPCPLNRRVYDWMKQAASARTRSGRHVLDSIYDDIISAHANCS